MNIPESQSPRDTDPSTLPPRDPAPKREFGTMKGELNIPDEFFEPLRDDELVLWEQ
jgi:hypothetical protein